MTKDEIVAAIAARKRDTVAVEVPEWGGTVNIRRLSAGELDATGMISGEESAETSLKVLAASLCDEDGELLFGIDELRALDDIDAMLTLRLFAECARVNGLMSEELEELVAGFDAAQPEGSSTD